MSVRPHPQQKTNPKYADAWLIDFYDGQGKRHKYTHRGAESQAREIEHSLRIRTKRTPSTAHPSLLEAAPPYVEQYTLDHLPSGTERLRRSMKIVLRLLGRYQFPSLTSVVIEEYKRTRLSEQVKPNTINKELACLSGFAKWAHEQGYCERLFIKRFPLKLARAPMPTVPSRKEVIKFLRALPRAKRGLWAAMYYCGLRSSEARNLTTRHVNWALNVVIVTGKGNKQRVVPLNRKIKPYLRDGLPFYGARDLRVVARWAVKRAGLTIHIHPHLMRHAFGVHMTEKGVPLRALQDIMGHSSSQVTELYSRLAAEALGREMGKF
jgi:site-specific recombinase XerD